MAEQFAHTILLDKEELDRLNRILTFDPAKNQELIQSEDPAVRARVNEIYDEDLFYRTVDFPDGKNFTLRMIPSDGEYPAYVEATLDDAEGLRIAFTDNADNQNRLDIPWKLEDIDGNVYTINIQPKYREQEHGAGDSIGRDGLEHFSSEPLVVEKEQHAVPDVFEDTLAIEPEKLDYLKRILSVNPSDYVTPATKDRLYEVDDPAIQEFVDSIGETPFFQESFPYPDGNTAIFTVWPPSDETSPAYAEMCLYVDGDAHIYDGQNNSQDPLEGKWEVTDPHTGHIYTLNVEERKRAIDKTPFAERLSALREKTFKALDAYQDLPAEARGKDYAALAHELPETLAALKHELARRIPQEPTSIDKRAGEYLATGRIDWKPFGKAAQKEAETLVPALCTFAEKMAMVEDTFLKAKETNLPEGCVPPDIIQYKDAVMELRKAAPTILHNHLFVADFSREKEHLLQNDLERSYREAVKNINFLRGNTPLKGKESLAEKTMRKVYSEHKDTVDYDKLNQETVARLIEKGASDKSIRKVAEIAKTINPSIQDTKVYAKDLTAQAKQSREAARG